jgi:hypothetical protein
MKGNRAWLTLVIEDASLYVIASIVGILLAWQEAGVYMVVKY